MNRICLILYFLVVVLSSPLFAQEKGQIININQGFQIAFTDLGDRFLKPGDIVKVFINKEDFVYMQVMESSAILSKLGISHKEEPKTNLQDLKRIAIGNVVTQFLDVPTEKNSIQSNVVEPKNIEISSSPAVNIADVQKLSIELNETKVQMKQLQDVNADLKAQINNTALVTRAIKIDEGQHQGGNNDFDKVLSELKVRLESIGRILDQK